MADKKPLSSLKGVGKKTEQLFAKVGVITIDDLLSYYPRGYEVYEAPLEVDLVHEGTLSSIRTTIKSQPDIVRIRGMVIVTVTLKGKDKTLYLTWYNMPYMRTQLLQGSEYIFRGHVVKKRSRLMIEQPEIFTGEAYAVVENSMQPVYALTKGLTGKLITRCMRQALDATPKIEEYLTEELRKKYDLAEINYATRHIHFPKDNKELLASRKRLVFDEFLFFLIGIYNLKQKRTDEKTGQPIPHSEKMRAVEAALGFTLTTAQERVLGEVLKDMAGPVPMNRLIQGDVGSGKTVIAFYALILTALNGFQGAMMVPTEVLAVQHYEALHALLKRSGLSLTPLLYTGSMSAREKRLVREKISRHEADLVIGTHTLIQESVTFACLSLVVTDEQHRFGVSQRARLGDKGERPHTLVMSATPIPRTLAIILYGDLDISVIDERPSGRLPVKNCVVGPQWRKNAYAFIAREIAGGHQAYCICPMVEEGGQPGIENVIEYTQKLRAALPEGTAIESLHGRMKPKEKNDVMARFASGKTQVLVSTTVVEVGVDVPNATVMMIENAERFGLAQLHQLRGRIGRGAWQSYCILINATGDEKATERLEILNHSNDGFYIADEDLKLRGPGDIFGVRQSGSLPFRLADIYTDARILKEASEAVRVLFKEDPLFLNNEGNALAKKFMEYRAYGMEKVNL